MLKNWRHRLTKAQGYTSQDIDYQQIKKCIQIGLLCVKFDPVKRPTIKEIMKMLEKSEVMSPPNYFFIILKTNQSRAIHKKIKNLDILCQTLLNLTNYIQRVPKSMTPKNKYTIKKYFFILIITAKWSVV